jgi:actin-like ATPase involved in cell morphogenesis
MPKRKRRAKPVPAAAPAPKRKRTGRPRKVPAILPVKMTRNSEEIQPDIKPVIVRIFEEQKAELERLNAELQAKVFGET